MPRFFPSSLHGRHRSKSQTKGDESLSETRRLNPLVISAPKIGNSSTESSPRAVLEFTKVPLDKLSDGHSSLGTTVSYEADYLVENGTHSSRRDLCVAHRVTKNPCRCGSSNESKFQQDFSGQDCIYCDSKNIEGNFESKYEESLKNYSPTSAVPKAGKFPSEYGKFLFLMSNCVRSGSIIKMKLFLLHTVLKKFQNNYQGSTNSGQDFYQHSQTSRGTDNKQKLKLELHLSDMAPLLSLPDYYKLYLAEGETSINNQRSPSVYSNDTTSSDYRLNPFSKSFATHQLNVSDDERSEWTAKPTFKSANAFNTDFYDLNDENASSFYREGKHSGASNPTIFPKPADCTNSVSYQSARSHSFENLSPDQIESLKIIDQHAKSILSHAPSTQLYSPSWSSSLPSINSGQPTNFLGKLKWEEDERSENFKLHTMVEINQSEFCRTDFDMGLPDHRVLANQLKKPTGLKPEKVQKSAHYRKVLQPGENVHFFRKDTEGEKKKQNLVERFEQLLRASDESAEGTIKISLTPKLGESYPEELTPRPKLLNLEDTPEFDNPDH
ncbi:expressed protein [Phakopsora pachyrhizi]|uniref:Expressed protein n=1 Tax=Phakopsora pachyrhizi TaxID=170000 RepID=A0AAV0BU45_PHAPC|nr:expressed protein [Phakopsora pachyrhizi]